MAVTVVVSSMPELVIVPTFSSCEFRKPSDGICLALNSASVMLRLYHVNWVLTRSPNAAASKPSSISLVRSGPRSGLPTLSGKNAGCPPHPVPPAFSHVRTASNAPGARPDCPHAARTFISGITAGQYDSSDATHEALSLG